MALRKAGWVVTSATRAPSIYTVRPSRNDARCSAPVLQSIEPLPVQPARAALRPKRNVVAKSLPKPSPGLRPAAIMTAILPSGRIRSLRCHWKVTMSSSHLMRKVRSSPLRVLRALRFIKFSLLLDLLLPAPFDSVPRRDRAAGDFPRHRVRRRPATGPWNLRGLVLSDGSGPRRATHLTSLG